RARGFRPRWKDAVLRRPREGPLRHRAWHRGRPGALRRATGRHLDPGPPARLGLALDAAHVGWLYTGPRPLRGGGRGRDRFRVPATLLQLPSARTRIDTLRPYGVRDLAQVGAAAAVHVDTRDLPTAATRGIAIGLGGSFYPQALGLTSALGEGHAEVASYLTLHVPLQPTLAVRVAGKKVWSTLPVPFEEAAYIGGATTVRGFVEHRFVGDAAVYGNVELRLSLTRFFILLPGELGGFGLGDAG